VALVMLFKLQEELSGREKPHILKKEAKTAKKLDKKGLEK
jgi:hypothetical protein